MGALIRGQTAGIPATVLQAKALGRRATWRAAAEAVSRGWFRGGAVFVDLRGYEFVVANRAQSEQVFAAVLRELGVPAEGRCPYRPRAAGGV